MGLAASLELKRGATVVMSERPEAIAGDAR